MINCMTGIFDLSNLDFGEEDLQALFLPFEGRRPSADQCPDEDYVNGTYEQPQNDAVDDCR